MEKIIDKKTVYSIEAKKVYYYLDEESDMVRMCMTETDAEIRENAMPESIIFLEDGTKLNNPKSDNFVRRLCCGRATFTRFVTGREIRDIIADGETRDGAILTADRNISGLFCGVNYASGLNTVYETNKLTPKNLAVARHAWRIENGPLDRISNNILQYRDAFLKAKTKVLAGQVNFNV